MSPGTALLVRNTVLVGYGYLPQVADFIHGATLPTDETRGCVLGGPVRITGRTRVAFGFVSVSVDDSTVHLHHLTQGAAHVFVDGYTRIDGLARNGLPYIGVGQRIQVDARFCKVPGSIGTKIVARRISPAGPIVAPPTAADVLGAEWRGRPDAFPRATGGHSWAAYLAIGLALVAAGSILVRHRSRRSGTG